MSNDFNATSDTHVYKFKPGVIVMYLSTLVLTGIAIGLFLLINVSRSHSMAQSEVGWVKNLFFGLSILIVILLGLMALAAIVSVIQAFTSYIKITPEGIEHHEWLSQHICLGWSEIDRLDKFLFYDALYPKSFEIVGPSIMHTTFLKYLYFGPTTISLSFFRGWPDGPMADDFKRFAPEIFEQRAQAESLQARQHALITSDITQEQRALAALSHGSILLAGFGVFFALIIYATQKKKSAYLEFQALQAFYYQLLGSILGIVFPLVYLAGLVAALIGVVRSEGAIMQTPFFVGGVILLIVMTLLFLLGSIAFCVYAVVGAVKTYQGKDFRYTIIGNWVAKSNNA